MTRDRGAGAGDGKCSGGRSSDANVIVFVLDVADVVNESSLTVFVADV